MWNPRNKVTQRWTAAERKRINRDFNRRAKRFLDDLPTVVHGGIPFVDLRGFPFDADVMIDLDRVDLSECNMTRGGIGAIVSLTDCLFRGARMRANVGYDLRRCDFTGANLRGSSLRGRFRDCSFVRANLCDASDDPGVRFLRCDFADARLRDVSFGSAVFDRCNWAGATIGDGSFVGARFLGTRPTSAQFGDALLKGDDALSASDLRQIEQEVAKQFRREAALKGIARAKRRARRTRSDT